MSFFTTTDKGKCDVTLTYFDEYNIRIAQRSITLDIKPTLKEVKSMFVIEGAKRLRITTTPSCNVKEFKCG